jgi:hypothetical protein
VVGNKRDTVRPQTKRAPVSPEFRNVDSIEAVRPVPSIARCPLLPTV